jgi:hypothetical protein
LWGSRSQAGGWAQDSCWQFKLMWGGMVMWGLIMDKEYGNLTKVDRFG